MKKILLIFLSFFILSFTIAQKNHYWTINKNKKELVTDKSVSRISFPKVFIVFDLNIDPLRQELFKVVDNSQSHSTVISLPNADGQIEQFEVYEASNFEPALQARFPEIRAFSGKGITDKYATLKLSISPQGIQTMVFRTEKPNEFIEPYSQDHTSYAVFAKQRNPGQSPWTCSTADEHFTNELNAQVMRANNTSRSTGDLKTLRLAQSCNAEYSNYFGATSASQVALVLAAFNATITRCNGCYEKDLAVHLNLIANTTSVIYYVAGTDPYTTMNSWNGQLQSTLTSVIGEANYDIGHMFGASGGGGNSGCIGCICVNNQKGSGITSPADGIPQGDNFDIDYVVHEVGHQMGGNHTFSMSLEGAGVNKEIGSGITIMGYAGITSQDVAPHSIDIYHEATIAQIQSNLTTKTCPITTSLAGNNATPVVAPVGNYIIPKSTPFALTGSATDADGDPITYCWEQNDNSTASGAASVASATKTNGPNWLSFSPTSSPTRICPKLDRILAGQLFSGPLTGGDAGANTEYLSSVARTLNFRLTVRDNCPYSSTAPIKVGQTAFTDMSVTVNGTAGPFAVSTPNATGITWQAGTSQTVIWSVNGSDQAPVSCANVKISLSTDGGYTWPIVLADNTPNDGVETIIVPNNITTNARIKVEAVGNIFFNINNSNFTITCSNPNSSNSVTNLTACENFLPYLWNGITCSAAGSYSYITSNSQGCDSLAVLNLFVTPTLVSEINPSICSSLLPYAWGGQMIQSAGTYTHTFTSTIGCDSVVTLNLIVNDSACNTSTSFNCNPDTTVDICVNPCITLKAKIQDIHASTSDYVINPISTNGGCYAPYVNPDNLGPSANLTIDDTYSSIIPLPFLFPFYDDQQSPYNSLVIATNGFLSFDVTKAGGYAHWSMVPGNVPNTSYDPSLIMGVFHDLDPFYTTSPNQQIKYEVVGDAPNRKFVVSYYQVPLFSVACQNAIENIHQIVLHESTGIIEVFVKSIEQCPSWNGNRKMIGLQNYNTSKAIMAPGRSALDSGWGTLNMNEAWRFVPSAGPTLFRSVKLYDLNGNFVANGDTTATNANSELEVSFPNVCSSQSKTYVIKSQYESITTPGTFIYLFDTVRVVALNSNCNTYCDSAGIITNDTTICLGNEVMLTANSIPGNVVGNGITEEYINGNLVTGNLSSNGTSAPSGYSWSEVQLGNVNAGFGAQIENNLSLADDFTVSGGTWTVSKFTFYAYSTGYTGTISPFQDLRLQIFDTDPSSGAAVPIFGDLTTNVLTTSTSANIYRIFNATPGTTRLVWKIEANVNVVLPQGTYWVEWQTGVATGLTSNFTPPSTIVGATTQPGYNAKQHDLTANTWTQVTDGTTIPNNFQDFNFIVNYHRPRSIYQWSTGDTTASINVSPTQTTTYYCTISNGISSCTDSVTVTLNTCNTFCDSVGIINNDTTICRGAVLTLSAGQTVTSGLVRDFDGNTYPTVNIGTQTWTQKNLNVSRYRNGDVIPQVITSAQWSSISTGAWCWYNNDSARYASTYGKLYNWYAVNDSRGIAPLGWHVPTDQDFLVLTYSILGGPSAAGGKMKEAGTTHWNSPNLGATNSSGFTGLPGGDRNYFGTFDGNIGAIGAWWSSTESAPNSTFAWQRTLLSDTNLVSYSGLGKGTGLSLRLIRDPFTYLWSNGATTASINVSPAQTTTYYCTISNGITSCIDSVTVTVNYCNTFCDSVGIINNNTTLCQGATINLQASSAASISGRDVCSMWSSSLQNGLVGCWPFNGNANDESGYGHNGVVSGAVLTNDRFGNIGKAYNFNGVSNYIQTNYIGVLGSNKRTLSFWAKTNSVVATDGMSAVSWGSDTLGSRFDGYFNFLSVGATSNIASAAITYNTPQPVNNNIWHHYVFLIDTINPTISSVRVYQDGVLLNSRLANYGSLSTPVNTLGRSPVQFGKSVYVGIPAFFKGQLDDIAIWNRALSNQEIQQLFYSGNATIHYLWSTGDTTSTISVSPSQTTTYYCTISNGVNSCTDSVIVIVSIPDTSIRYMGSSGICVGGSTLLQAGNASSYQWLFNGAVISGATSQMYNATQAGSYSVIVTNSLGCRDTSRLLLVSLYPTPNSNFAINNPTQCLSGNSFVFTNTSTIAFGNTTYLWTFGDGGSSTSTNTTHTYTTAGTYTVILYATSSNGCRDTIARTVVVNPTPSASFTINDSTQCTNANSYVFTNTSTILYGTMTYQWNFGDGTIVTTANPSHTYTTAGTYTVTLTATSNYGCVSIVRHTVIVYPSPDADFTVNNSTQCLSGNIFVFTNTSTIASGNTTYLWTFGDGGSSTSTNTTHAYTTAGTYTVILYATSNNGCRDTIARTVVVNPTPSASFTINDSTQCANANSYVFTNTSTITSGTMTYLWSFGDGTIVTTANPSHTYTTAGTYTVTLTATSNYGCVSTVSHIVIVYPKPSPSFTINDSTQCVNENTYVFTNTSTITSGTLSYQWSFGDGGTSTTMSPSHTYDSSGTYIVWLVVTSNNGCLDSVRHTVTLYPKPQPQFSINDTTQCLTGNSYVFTNLSTITSGTLSYQWSFGDGGTSTTMNAIHSYASSGTFNVKLLVLSNNGCRDSVTIPVTVYAMPIGVLNAAPQLYICDGSSVTLTASGGSTYQWYLNGNIIPGATASQYDATAGGVYTVQFTNSNGCSVMSNTSITLSLITKPEAEFTYTNSCVNTPIFFRSTSTILGSLPVRYTWLFGDGSFSSTANPVHIYDTVSSYTVLLIVTPQRCPDLSDTVSHQIRIVAPRDGISYVPKDAIINRPLQLNSRDFGVSYMWNPSTGLNNAAIMSPVLTPTVQQLFTIKIVDSFGCVTVDTQLVRVHRQCDIQAPQVFTPNRDGNNDLLYPFLMGIREFKYFRVYNRWGNLIFETRDNNPSRGWDGTYRGKPQPPETYKWVSEGVDIDGNRIIRGGDVILVR